MVKWDLKKLIPEGSEKLISELNSKVEEFKKYRGKINIDNFLIILNDQEEISGLAKRLNGYSSLWLSENTSSSERNSYNLKVSQLLTDVENELLFFSLWFKSLSDKEAKKFIDISEEYYYHLESIRLFKDHTLKEKEEQILNLKDITGVEAITRLYDIITNKFKFDWKGKKITQSDLTVFVRSSNPEIREAAYRTLLEPYAREEMALGEVYKTVVLDWYNENLKLRKFKTPISVRNLANDVPDEAVNALLNVVRKNTGIFQEYFRIKADLLGMKKLSRFHLYAPVSDFDKSYSFEESKKIVLETYRNFSEKAYSYAKEIFDLDNVHSEIALGKQSGAFCYTVVKDIAPFILLNFAGKLNDVSTMMHEFGHGIHGRAARGQTQFTFHSALPMAETASIFGETLLENRLLKESSDKDKINLLINTLDGFYASIMRQVFFVIFEKEAHEMIVNNATIEELNSAYLKNLKEQFGSAMNIPDDFKHEWKYIPHIYHTPFYCYAYAFGNLLGLSLYKMYEREGGEFAEKYMKLLSYGGGNSPGKILKEIMNVDITSEKFWQGGFDIIKENLEELKKLGRTRKA